MLDGAKGANPTTEDPSQKKSEDKSDDGEEKSRKNKVGGQERSQTYERIKVEKYFYVADIVFSWKAGLQEEDEK